MVNQSSSESHNLNLETFSSRIEMSNQIAANGQTEITHMDADLCEALEEHGAVVRALLDAAKALHLEIESGIVKSLIEEDPEFIHGANTTGHTPLYMTTEKGYGDLVGIIIGNTRASPSHSGIMGRTALHASVIREDQDKSSDKSVTYLAIKDSKKTALHFAANRHHIETVKLLLSHSADCFSSMDNTVDKMALDDDKLTTLDILSRANIKLGQKFGAELVKQLEEWKKVVVGPFSWQGTINKDEENSSTSCKTRQDNGATVTFATGFTLPGGYNDNDGMIILTKKAAFKAFVMADTIAVTLSISPAFVYFPILSHRNEELIGEHLTTEAFLTMFGMGAMVVAFMTGIYAVLPLSSGLPIITCIICCFFLLAFSFVFRQLRKAIRQ
ncbi:hypothetical protein AAG906_013114 [Vitis piasezkii]